MKLISLESMKSLFIFFILFSSITIYSQPFDSPIRVVNDADYSGDTIRWANFRNIRFNGPAFFTEASFWHITNFSRAKFEDRTMFNAAQFESMANFDSVQFESTAEFNFTQFESADFDNARFMSKAFFWAARFNYVTTFGNTQFDSITYFDHSVFKYFAIFDNIEFKSEVNFNDVRFEGYPIFHEIHFLSKVDFSSTYFSSKARFSYSKFESTPKLNNLVLPDTLYFSFVTSNEVIDFTYTKLDSAKHYCTIDLYGTDVSKLKFDYTRFRILKDSSRYEKRHYSHMYEQILKMQKEQGYIDGAQTVDKEYKEFKLTFGKAGMWLILGKTNHYINKYWWDYGYKKDYIYLWTFFFLLTFTLINTFIFVHLNSVYKIQKVYDTWPSNTYAEKNRFSWIRIETIFQKFITSLYYTSIVFFGLRLEVGQIEFRYRVISFYILVQYIVGILCMAYLANYIILS